MHNPKLQQAQQERITSRKLDERLFDTFSELNRDWRRIAETETATNFNNGYLLTELDKAPDDKPVLMRGISGGGACPFRTLYNWWLRILPWDIAWPVLFLTWTRATTS